MKWLPSKTVKIAKLKLPGDISQRRKAPHVADRAASIKAHGLIQLPVVEVGTNRLVVGRDRIAALMELGEKSVEVRYIEGSEQDLAAIEIIENLERRNDDIHDLRARYVAVMEGVFAKKFAETTPRQSGENGNGGRPANPHSEAVRTVADAGKTTEAVVRKSEEISRKRAAAKEKAKEKAAQPESPAEPAPEAPPSLLGREVDEYNAQVASLTAEVKGVIRNAAKLASCTATLPVAPFDRARQEMQRAQQILQGALLVGKCPICGDTTLPCALCGGVGFVTEFQLAGLPRDNGPRTLLRAPARVVAEPKRLTIELPDGSQFDEPETDTELF